MCIATTIREDNRTVPNGILELSITAPGVLAEAIGYEGVARFVAFFWGCGDEVCWEDGRTSFCGANWDAWLLFVRHRKISPHIEQFNFGNSDEAASHWLLLDRVTNKLYAGSVNDVGKFLRFAWFDESMTASPDVPEMTLEELTAMFKEGLATTSTLDMEEFRKEMKRKSELLKRLTTELSAM